jgi:3-oxoisoapionate decarboxylase
MTRREISLLPLSALATAQPATPPRLGLNTYCLRALRWHDAQLLDYAASLKLDAVFLQDSLDPQAKDPAHWPQVKAHAERLGLHLETGGSSMYPRNNDAAGVAASIETLLHNIRRAAAMGSPLVRALVAGDRYALPRLPMEQIQETVLQILRAARSEALDRNVKIAIEVHKDLQAWEHRELIVAAGKDYVGTYLDTGNPPFVAEDPLLTLETLGEFALTVHLRDSVLFENQRGIAVQWVPLGEGVIDFARYMKAVQERCPAAVVYIKPVTGRPPQTLPVWDPGYWELFPKARAAEFARFVALARKGQPYEGNMVLEDLLGRPTPPQFVEAIRAQQQDHMERSVAYAKSKLQLGRKWRA